MEIDKICNWKFFKNMKKILTFIFTSIFHVILTLWRKKLMEKFSMQKKVFMIKIYWKICETTLILRDMFFISEYRVFFWWNFSILLLFSKHKFYWIGTIMVSTYTYLKLLWNFKFVWFFINQDKYSIKSSIQEQWPLLI